MLEFIGSGILGSIFGGVFRLAPEVLKFLDRKEDRKHELSMLDKQLDFEKAKGAIRVEERTIDYGVAQIDAISKAFEEQSNTASKSYKWVSALSALVRPTVTYVLFAMYVAYKATIMVYAIQLGEPWVSVVQQSWTPDDFAMLNGTIMFWFVGRSIDKR